MKQTGIKLFKEDTTIDVPTLIDSRMLIIANSGGGKSYVARKLLEETHGKVLSIVLDIEGEFKTLREDFDFLLIGEGGDVELNMKSASLLPKKILELEVSTIIDISELKRNDRIKYAKKFLEALMELPRKYWKPCLVLLDETHILAGQQEKQESTFSVIDLFTRGRKRGFCGVALTQRISKLHKDVAAECNNVLVGRTGLDIDMKRASEILGFSNKKDMLSLRELNPGEFFVFGTAISRFVKKLKVEKVKTTHPKVGMDLKNNISPPTKKIKDILSRLNDLSTDTNVTPSTDKSSLRKISALNLELNQLKKTSIARQEHNNLIADLNNEKKYSKNLLEKIQQVNRILNVESRKIDTTPKTVEVINRPKPVVVSNESYGIQLGLCAKKIYNLLTQYPDKQFSKAQISIFSGYSIKSGSFNNSLSNLRSLGLIKSIGDSISVNKIDESLIGEYDYSMNAIIGKLNKCEKEIFDVLKNNSMNDFDKTELANLTASQYSYTSGSFNNSISRLNTLGILEKIDGRIKLNQELLEI